MPTLPSLPSALLRRALRAGGSGLGAYGEDSRCSAEHYVPEGAVSARIGRTVRDACVDTGNVSDVVYDAHSMLRGEPTYTPDDYAWLFPDTDTITCDISTASLIGPYLEACKLDTAEDPEGLIPDNDPVAEMKAMHPSHTFQLRRSARLIDRAAMNAAVPPAPAPQCKRQRSRKEEPAAIPSGKRVCRDLKGVPDRWIQDGELVLPKESWTEHQSTGAVIGIIPRIPADLSLDATGPPGGDEMMRTKRRRRPHAPGKTCGQRGGRFRKILPNGERNPLHLVKGLQRVMERSDAVVSNTFSLMLHGSHSKTGLQGAQPPMEVRKMIRDLFFELPEGRALYPYLKYFFPVEYHHQADPKQERATFLVDRDGQVFFYRSFRALWLADCIEEFEEAIRILIGDDDQDTEFKASCAGLKRGPHMPIIIGYQRQSSKLPYLTAWHRNNEPRVVKFMAHPLVKRIMGWIANVMRLIFPGITRQMDEDAKWHKIKPPFADYFWNLCLNAMFEGQRSVSTGPHADAKNQVLVCLMLVYVLKSGVKFNDAERIWLWLWEPDVAIQLPAWTLAAYPSALLYHFNLHPHDIQLVTTDGNERPTRTNSRPIQDGDANGRGSLVFFNQATMRNGPVFDCHTLKEARACGQTGTVDYGDCIHTAFEKALVLTPVPQEIIDRY
ncbi:hypothetical protein B0H10DRAFT_2225997 [Mycena sp. CBHHK59/15]|nr:hypothetical protein B0H10DRAFT_2225997 [Mycena sp. CBHHK59/15]